MVTKDEFIFLNNPDILEWERPIDEGWVSILETYRDLYNSYTNIIKFLRLDTLSNKIGKYYVRADVSKFLVEIITKEQTDEAKKVWDLMPKQKILFLGNISIYVHGVIHGTNVKG
jgi:hypothetical protein